MEREFSKVEWLIIVTCIVLAGNWLTQSLEILNQVVNLMVLEVLNGGRIYHSRGISLR